MLSVILLSVGFKVGSYVATLVAGGYLGFKYGSYVEKEAAAALAKAGSAASGAASKV
jgi:hypothetical protein